jgi:hypothetical protein
MLQWQVSDLKEEEEKTNKVQGWERLRNVSVTKNIAGGKMHSYLKRVEQICY